MNIYYIPILTKLCIYSYNLIEGCSLQCSNQNLNLFHFYHFLGVPCSYSPRQRGEGGDHEFDWPDATKKNPFENSVVIYSFYLKLFVSLNVSLLISLIPPLFPSQTHLPGYVNQADAFKAKGVKEIVCVGVNDPFVMSAWGKEHNVEGKVSFLCNWVYFELSNLLF